MGERCARRLSGSAYGSGKRDDDPGCAEIGVFIICLIWKQQMNEICDRLGDVDEDEMKPADGGTGNDPGYADTS